MILKNKIRSLTAIVSLLFIFICGNNFSQNKNADSLRAVLKTQKEDTNKVKTTIKLSIALWESEDFATISAYLTEARDLAQKLDFKTGYANACNNLGILYLNQGLYEKALESHLNALKTRQQINDKKGIVSSYQNLGIVYIALKDYDKAIECYTYCYNTKKEVNDQAGMASALQGLGSVYRKMKDPEKSIKYFFQSLKIREALKDTDAMASIFNNIGLHYLEQDRNEEALKYFLKSLEIVQRRSSEFGLQMVYGNLSKTYSRLKKHDEALKYAKMSLAIIKKSGNSLDQLKTIEKTLTEIYEGMGNRSEAYEHYKKFIQYRDSMFNEENTKKAVQSQMNFEFEKKQEIIKAENEKALALAAEEKRRKNIVLSSVSIGLILVLLLAVVILRSLILNRKKNKIIVSQKELVEEKQKEVLDSINYAKRIQKGILPDDNEFKKVFSDSFVLYKPKDIVSGDFYWFLSIVDPQQNKNIAAFAAADCTGHGVPGAFMSMLNSTLLNQTAYNPAINTPADALNFLNKELPKNLRSFDKNSTIKDGMDLAFCLIDFNQNTLQYSGANNPCLIIRNNELIELKPMKQAITAAEEFDKKEFTNQTFTVQKNDIIYLFTDGYADQFGGPRGKKFKYRQLNDLLLLNHHLPLTEQKEKLEETFMNWKGGLEQVDDVLIVGIKI